MQTILGVITGFIILTILVIIHEFGHFLVAIKNGVTVEEFGIGFPPRAIAWIVKKNKSTNKYNFTRLDKTNSKPKSKDLIFSINWLPIGGFCSMKGENASSKEPNSFGNATFWQKTKILFAGVTFNFIFAVIILTILSLTGLPKFLPNQFNIKSDQTYIPSKIIVKDIRKDSPADKANIKVNDRILAIDDINIDNPIEIIQYTQSRPNQTIKIALERDGVNFTTRATLNPVGADYKLGLASIQDGYSVSRYTWSAPVVGLFTTIQLTHETFVGIGNLLKNLTTGLFSQFSPNETTRKTGQEQINLVGKSVSGPIGIVSTVFPSLVSNPTFIALLTAIISVSLACMNVLPIPALDGGRWLTIAIYKLRKKELDKKTEEKIVGRAFLFLLGLIILISIIDIIRIFTNK